MAFMYIMAIILLLIPVKIVFPIKKLGYKKIPHKKERLIIVCNHLSIRDIFVMGSMFPERQIHFLAKKELFKNRFVSWLFKRLGVVPVSRGEFDFQAIKSVVSTLNKNKTVGIFPEGTRNKVSQEEMLELKNGVALFSLKTGAKIVPLYQSQKQRFFRRNYIYIGEAFDFEGIEGDKINKEKLGKATEKLTEEMNKAKAGLFQYLDEHNIKIKEPKEKKKKKLQNAEK